jgi:prevent-host-death family protein
MEHVNVGVRELKNRLSHYLHAVQQGKIIMVTRRGNVIARLVPVSSADKATWSAEVEERMWKLAAEGVVSWSGGPFQLPEPTAVNQGPDLLSDLVVEDRE